MSDKIIRGTAGNGSVRFFGIDCTETVKEAAEIHDLSTTSTFYVGRMIQAALIMGEDLKTPDSLITITLKTDGMANGTTVTANGSNEVKCLTYADKDEVLSEDGTINVKQAIGNGNLVIIKDLGLKEPYTGTVELVYGEIAQDIAYYYLQSEQIPTAISLGVLVFGNEGVRKAGGFMVQLLPGAKENLIEKIEKNIQKFPNFTDMMDIGHSIEDLLINHILKDLNAEVKATKSVAYKCNCSKDKYKKGLASLGIKELNDAISYQNEIEVKCHFCNKRYLFSKDEVKSIILSISGNKGRLL
ncbi:MAG: Hsp33 family molecular chaperone HslO [Candidatus Delongbacteria bacterium]|nr:Hsp33 family molecular chaperone HslO [Candidatus Delongbacteria bacterium]MBN2835489.1 Hsp33 family molecular chaperone HslO [Candidatus Delongbacteria bacterium]